MAGTMNILRVARVASLLVAVAALSARAEARSLSSTGTSPCGGAGSANDWLVVPCTVPANFSVQSPNGPLVLSNGLVSRTLVGAGGSLGTASVALEVEGELCEGALLDHMVPEATLEVNGVGVYVGGNGTIPTPAGTVRTQWPGALASPPRVSTPTKRYDFTPGRFHAPPQRQWPPAGVRVELDQYLPCAAVNAGQVGDSAVVTFTVAYELYTGITSFGRTVGIAHNCSVPLYVYNMTVWLSDMHKDRCITLEMDPSISTSGQTKYVDGVSGPHSQRFVNVAANEAVPPTTPMFGPGLSPLHATDEPFVSFFHVEVIHDVPFPNTVNVTLRGMGRYGRASSMMHRTVAPQSEQMPISVEAVCTGGQNFSEGDGRVGYWCYDERGTADLRTLIHQAAEVGVEAIIVAQNMNSTWRSMVGVEFQSEANMTWFKVLVDYAKSQGVELGLYQLLKNARSWSSFNTAAPSIAPMVGYDDVDPTLQLPCHNGAKQTCKGGSGCCSLCTGTSFFDSMKQTMLDFWDFTGMSIIDQDGSGSGQPCANESHIHHHGLNDSMWVQWTNVRDLYHAYLQRGGFVCGMPGNFLSGGQSKLPGGYDEETWSEPRWTWIDRARERMIADYQHRDFTTPNCVRTYPIPFTTYHPNVNINGTLSPIPGQPSSADVRTVATLEPLDEHLLELNWALSNSFATGIYAHLRVFRMYQSTTSRDVIANWIAWFKAYHIPLIQDFQTIQWGNGSSWDAVIHCVSQAAHPESDVRCIATFWNSMSVAVNVEAALPVYFSGLTDKAELVEEMPPTLVNTSATWRQVAVSANRTVQFQTSLPPRGIKYVLLK